MTQNIMLEQHDEMHSLPDSKSNYGISLNMLIYHFLPLGWPVNDPNVYSSQKYWFIVSPYERDVVIYMRK